MGAKVRGLSELQRGLLQAIKNAIPDAKKIVGQGCNNIKKGAARIIKADSHHGYLPHYPRSIGYDVKASGTTVTGEIGPKTEREQGGLGGLLENGSINNAPIPHLAPAQELETPEFVDQMGRLGQALIEGTAVTGGPVSG